MNNSHDRLVAWYCSQCDGVWEHTYGLKLSTLDNPGFALEIDLKGTHWKQMEFLRVTDDYDSENHWLTCWKEDEMFHAAEAPCRLTDMIDVFLDWVDPSVRK